MQDCNRRMASKLTTSPPITKPSPSHPPCLGKTEAAKLCLNFITEVSKNGGTNEGTLSKRANSTLIGQAISKTSPVLESLGNGKTRTHEIDNKPLSPPISNASLVLSLRHGRRSVHDAESKLVPIWKVHRGLFLNKRRGCWCFCRVVSPREAAGVLHHPSLSRVPP